MPFQGCKNPIGQDFFCVENSQLKLVDWSKFYDRTNLKPDKNSNSTWQ